MGSTGDPPVPVPDISGPTGTERGSLFPDRHPAKPGASRIAYPESAVVRFAAFCGSQVSGLKSQVSAFRGPQASSRRFIPGGSWRPAADISRSPASPANLCPSVSICVWCRSSALWLKICFQPSNWPVFKNNCPSNPSCLLAKVTIRSFMLPGNMHFSKPVSKLPRD